MLRPPRDGMEPYQVRAIAYGLYVWGLTAAVLLFVGPSAGMRPGQLFLWIIFAGGAAGALVGVVAAYLSERVGDKARVLYAPTGASTPYEPVFSQEQAMAMRGDVAGALARFDERIGASPGDPRPRLAAAALCAGQGRDPSRAALLYRAARSLPAATPADEMAATNALIDLYRGPLADDSRAIAELRRLADRFPGTPAADGARRAIAAPKAARPPATS